MAEPALKSAVETPSGKGRGDENFPVGSWLIRRDLRPHVHAFYRFAREADDIADNPALVASEKLRRLDRMGAVLDGAAGDDAFSAKAMRASLQVTGTTAQHCHDVLRAFRLDATKLRYRDWDDLMEYCRYSASPVGRQLLDLHGESHATGPPSDALCCTISRIAPTITSISTASICLSPGSPRPMRGLRICARCPPMRDYAVFSTGCSTAPTD
jgi:farnesyl-diphosphate farnesyltransferase